MSIVEALGGVMIEAAAAVCVSRQGVAGLV